MMKTLLKNAKIYDGTGAEPYVGDILIAGERIVRAAQQIDAEADRVIDLQGKSVSSGFIDAHSQSDRKRGRPERSENLPQALRDQPFQGPGQYGPLQHAGGHLPV